MKKQIKKTAVFTTTISGQLLNWLDNEAKMQKTTKRQILEMALGKYRHDKEKQQFVDGFKRAANDPEMIWMAEAGIAEYKEMLKKFDQDNL